MGEEEEMRMRRDHESSNDEEERMLEWEDGLPSADDLTPLSQHLIPPRLASAFNVKPEPSSTILDVNRATHKTLSTLLLLLPLPFTNTTTSSRRRRRRRHEEDHPMVVEEHDHDDEEEDPPGTPTPPPTIDDDGSETRKIRRRVLLEDQENNTEEEEADSGFGTENSNDDDHHSARTLKRPRLVWTPQLHKRFVDVVAHLGINNAVPKTIMQLMNVQGLTRENVASHLQKYRLYLKRSSSSSDPLFASTTPVPHTLHHDHPPTGKQQHISHPPPTPPMPVLGHGFGGNPAAAYQGFEFHPYGMFRDQQRDWSGNRFGPMVSYPKASKR